MNGTQQKANPAHYLLHLELDGGAHILHLGQHGLVVADGRGELSSLGQARTQDTGDHLDQRLGCQESVVTLG